jgi:YD repeat-containing protein
LWNQIQQLVPQSFSTTYTHKPLVGVTSMTDPSGITIFYEYDSFGRLKAIRNHLGEYLERYDYHYKNQ